MFTYSPRSKWAPSEKTIFFSKIGIFCKSIAGALSEANTHWMVNWLQLLNQLNFLWLHIKVFMQNSPKFSIVKNDGKWMLMALHIHFLPQQHYSRMEAMFLAFHALVYRWGCQFLSFFSQDNIRSWRYFSSSKIRTQFSHTFCNITMIFKVMSQYFTALFKRIHNHIISAEG